MNKKKPQWSRSTAHWGDMNRKKPQWSCSTAHWGVLLFFFFFFSIFNIF